jgi:hypothetical protein
MKMTTSLPNTDTKSVKDGLKLFLKNFIIAYSVVALAVLPAEYNYQKAVAEAMQTDGTDLAIETALSKHGFDLDACDTNEPSILTKNIALFNLLKNQNHEQSN